MDIPDSATVVHHGVAQRDNANDPNHQSILTEALQKSASHETTLQEKTTRERTPSIASSDSSHSNNSDPLAPLEHTPTTDLHIEAEQIHQPYLTRTGTSVGTTGSRLPDFEVDFIDDDPENPKNWPLWYRGITIGFMSFSTWTTVLYSTTYTSAIPGMENEFHESELIVTLGVTTYLLGLACGALVLAPFSELVGRRPVYLFSMFIFMILILPCALAHSLSSIIVVRFFGALAGSAMISNAPGTINDISTDHYRALAFSIWSIGPMNAPSTGPIIGGFVYQYLGWRWTNWLVMILAGVSWIMTASLRESYAPIILKKKAAKLRKETGDERWWSRYDDKASPFEILKINLSRPFVLTFTEPILWFWNLYVGVVYGILYLCFVAYPIIYTDIRGWSPGISGLAFCGIGLGSVLSISFEPLFRKFINSHKIDPETGRVPPEASVAVICIAAICAPVGQLIFAWTSTPVRIHWIVGILAGVPFGFGNTTIFIYASNYIAGSYGIYAASALAGNSVVRSIFGGTLPLAGSTMYGTLNPRWAGTLLGLLEVILIPIPFVFYYYGDRIRRKSPLIRRIREDLERNEKRNERRVKRNLRAAEKLEKAGLVDEEKEVEGNGGVEREEVEKEVHNVTVQTGQE